MITYSRIIPTADCMDDFNKLCRHVESYTQEQIDYIKSKSWCGVNDKYSLGGINVPTKGFDNKYPEDILLIFYMAWLEVYHDFDLKECAVRDNKDFKDAYYFHETPRL